MRDVISVGGEKVPGLRQRGSKIKLGLRGNGGRLTVHWAAVFAFSISYLFLNVELCFIGVVIATLCFFFLLRGIITFIKTLGILVDTEVLMLEALF